LRIEVRSRFWEVSSECDRVFGKIVLRNLINLEQVFIAITEIQESKGFIIMPEIFRLEGYVFFFYANEGNEPMHVHVRRGGGYAKFWIEPLELDYAKGLKTKEIVRAEILITENLETIRRKWNNVFGT
jgi:hypothetical protein